MVLYLWYLINDRPVFFHWLKYFLVSTIQWLARQVFCEMCVLWNMGLRSIARVASLTAAQSGAPSQGRRAWCCLSQEGSREQKSNNCSYWIISRTVWNLWMWSLPWFPKEWRGCPRYRLQARAAAFVREGAGIWAVVPMQAAALQGEGSPCSPGHISHSKPPPLQSVQQLQWLPMGFHFSGESIWRVPHCSLSFRIHAQRR